MICPRCGNLVAARRNICEACGYDLSVYKKVTHVSNRYYNQGLEKAKVRDLSGAVVLLKKSLEMNKTNTNARNLLGLVYFEMGETVAAISEWVISKHFQAKENDADVYMDVIQSNPEKLEGYNQAIRKYNMALESAKQGTVDLAIIQLKKVIALHPKFLRANHLLALLYMKNSEYERARRILLKCKKVDIANTTTLRYLSEINRVASGGVATENPDSSQDDDYTGANAPIIMKENEYKEEKPNIMNFINLIVGVLIGLAVVSLLILPTRENQIKAQYEAERLDYSDELNSKIATIDSQATKISSLETTNEELKQSLAEATGQVEYVSVEDPVYGELYRQLSAAIESYIPYEVDKEMTASNDGTASEELCLAAAQALAGVDMTVTQDANIIALYESMTTVVFSEASTFTYVSGRAYYDAGDYENAIADLTKSVVYNPYYDRALYYLGKAYQDIESNERAAYYYTQLLENCPDSTLTGYAADRLAAVSGQN